MPQTYLLKFNIFKIYILKELIYLQIFSTGLIFSKIIIRKLYIALIFKS